MRRFLVSFILLLCTTAFGQDEKKLNINWSIQGNIQGMYGSNETLNRNRMGCEWVDASRFTPFPVPLVRTNIEINNFTLGAEWWLIATATVNLGYRLDLNTNWKAEPFLRYVPLPNVNPNLGIGFNMTSPKNVSLLMAFTAIKGHYDPCAGQAALTKMVEFGIGYQFISPRKKKEEN